jgi:hypothetical protein
MAMKLRGRVSRALRRRLHASAKPLISVAVSRLNLTLLLDAVFDSYYKRTSWFITWNPTSLEQKPVSSPYPITPLNLKKKVTQTSSGKFPNPFGSELTIVIQGQVISENLLTKKIVEHYLSNFNELKVVLSTWDNTPPKDLSVFEIVKDNPRFEILLNTPPHLPGVFNINNQIVSTREGLSRVVDQSKFAIKTRTDQLLSSPLLLENLNTLWKYHGEPKDLQCRLVVSSLNTFGFRLYGASDMFQFGKTQDLLNYWTQPLDERPISELTELSESMRAEAKKLVAEVYLNANYFEKVRGKVPSFSWSENLEFIRDAFVVADQHSLGQIWFKNTHLVNRWDFGFFPHKYYEFSHIDWIGLTHDSEKWLEREYLVDSKKFYDFE